MSLPRTRPGSRMWLRLRGQHSPKNNSFFSNVSPPPLFFPLTAMPQDLKRRIAESRSPADWDSMCAWPCFLPRQERTQTKPCKRILTFGKKPCQKPYRSCSITSILQLEGVIFPTWMIRKPSLLFFFPNFPASPRWSNVSIGSRSSQTFFKRTFTPCAGPSTFPAPFPPLAMFHPHLRKQQRFLKKNGHSVYFLAYFSTIPVFVPKSIS